MGAAEVGPSLTTRRGEIVLKEEGMEVVVERKVNNHHRVDAPDYASTKTSSTASDDDDDNEGCQSRRSPRPSSWPRSGAKFPPPPPPLRPTLRSRCAAHWHS